MEPYLKQEYHEKFVVKRVISFIKVMHIYVSCEGEIFFNHVLE